MFDSSTPPLELIIKRCARFIREENVNVETCRELQQILKNLSGHHLGYVIRTPRLEYTAGQIHQRYFLHNAKKKEKPSRNFFINVVSAGLAILYGKGKFFEIMVDTYPSALFTTKTSAIKIDSPLICAIDSCDLVLVTTVLSNIHFLAHELNKPQEHLSYINRCFNYAKQAHPREWEILRMLISVANIRTPLMAAVGKDVEEYEGNQFNISQLTSTCQLCLSPTFIEHQDSYPKAHKMMIKDCIKCVKKLFNKDISTAVSTLLEASLKR